LESDKRSPYLAGLSRPASPRFAREFDPKAGSHRPKAEICVVSAFSIQPSAFATWPFLLVLLHMAHHNPGQLTLHTTPVNLKNSKKLLILFKIEPLPSPWIARAKRSVRTGRIRVKLGKEP
jgi:hypothetical protein